MIKTIIYILGFLVLIYFASILFQKITSKINKQGNLNKENMNMLELDKKAESGELQKAVFSGGCFWCTEASFNPEYGVVSAISGFFDGDNPPSPTYENHGNYREGVLVYFDNASTTYKKLLVNYWHSIDPTQADGQFADVGESYKTAIYYFNEEQKKSAEESKSILQNSKKFADKKIVVEIKEGQDKMFFPAEEYHQDYAVKNPVRYEYYKNGSGRSDFIKENWYGDKTFEDFLKSSPSPSFIKEGSWQNFTKEMKEKRLKELTGIQYKVTQDEGTEKPFENEYDKNYSKGIYVDVVSGEPLYLSTDKFDSGTGWPSFVKPINADVLNLKTDNYLFYSRTEVRSKIADSHLGHVFDDGPVERGGKRYCMNSAALRFVPFADMEREGYGEFVNLIK